MTKDTDAFRIRPGILELIAGMALSSVEGVSGTGLRADHPEESKKKKNLTKGIKAEAEGRKAAIDLDVVMEYGRDFVALAGETQKTVAGMVEAMTGWEVIAVNVNVVGVSAL